ncbi:MAG TPA: hypothetical protein VFH88_04000, partial [Candidatus Krumholzibacteria bacterium]|nr:hypothetical protein [Candidatus Krumholzibacteria bacterium]
APVRKFVISMDDTSTATKYGRIALSSDGSRIAFVCDDRLWVRELARLAPVQLAGTDGADMPAWSPDGKQIAYRVGATIYRIGADGGSPTVISNTSIAFLGGSALQWTADGHILISCGSSSAMQVPVLGGDPTEVFPLPDDASDVHEASALPEGRGVLFAPHLRSGGPCEIRLWSNGNSRTLLKAPGNRLWHPRYDSSGYILYGRSPNNAGVWALPFSLSKLEVTGEPFLVAVDGAEPGAGPNGVLVYSPAGDPSTYTVAVVSRDGTMSKIGDLGESLGQPIYSPDGTRLAVVIRENGNGDVWVFDLVRGTRTRLTFAPGWDDWPSWSPDGRTICYTRSDHLMLLPSDGSGPARFLHAGSTGSYSPDGKWMVYEDNGPGTNADILALPMPADSTTQPVTIVATGAFEHNPRISPDGNYVAYESTESGDLEVFITRFPEPGGKWQVSTNGGQKARWDPNGKALYYASPGAIMQVDVTTSPTLQLGTPRPVLDIAKNHIEIGRVSTFDVTPGGKRFVASVGSASSRTPRLD